MIFALHGLVETLRAHPELAVFFALATDQIDRLGNTLLTIFGMAVVLLMSRLG